MMNAVSEKLPGFDFGHLTQIALEREPLTRLRTISWLTTIDERGKLLDARMA